MWWATAVRVIISNHKQAHLSQPPTPLVAGAHFKTVKTIFTGLQKRKLPKKCLQHMNILNASEKKLAIFQLPS